MLETRPLTLRKNFSWTFIGNVVYAVCQWGMLVVLAKLGSPEMVGQFTLGLAVTAPIIMFTNLQLRAVQATDAKQQFLFSDYLGLRLISTGLALVIITIICYSGTYQMETSLVIFLIGVAKAFESISDVFHGLIQQHERMDRIAISLMIKGPLSLLLLGIGVYLSGRVLWGVLGLLFAWVVVLFGYDIQQGVLILNANTDIPDRKIALNQESGSLRPHWHLKKHSRLFWLSLPMGFVMMLFSLNSNLPRYFIEQYLGERELGIFAAIAYLMMIGNIVVNALGQSAMPRLGKYYAAGEKIAFRKLMFKLVGIGLLLGGTLVLTAVIRGKEILMILYQPEYAQYTDLFVWLMVAAAISYISCFLGDAMTAARCFRIQVPLLILVTSTSAIASIWFIPSIGLQGAAIALIMGGSVQVVMSLGVIFYALRVFHKPTEKES
jgi:O-antigen/teichoic acid export membrane protein